jgi:hypothetical protein
MDEINPEDILEADVLDGSHEEDLEDPEETQQD